ncbi:MAG: hypothetical protein V3R87_12870 [Dehalococcoidia bacterium]
MSYRTSSRSWQRTMEAILATADGQLAAALKMAHGIANQCDEWSMPGPPPYAGDGQSDVADVLGEV